MLAGWEALSRGKTNAPRAKLPSTYGWNLLDVAPGLRGLLLMHFLLTNDDGIGAAGLAALQAAVESIGGRCSVVAPFVEQSMCGHRVTTHSALNVEERGPDRWAVAGTPADCVRIGLFALNLKPDWVLSGINHGGNMGQDLVISGTVAGVREACYHGIPAVAFSHYLISGIPVEWPRVTQWAARVLGTVMGEPQKDASFWNINFPHLPPGDIPMPKVLKATLARSPLNVSFRKDAGAYHYTAQYRERPQDEGSDVATCFGGKISLSRLSL